MNKIILRKELDLKKLEVLKALYNILEFVYDKYDNDSDLDFDNYYVYITNNSNPSRFEFCAKEHLCIVKCKSIELAIIIYIILCVCIDKDYDYFINMIKHIVDKGIHKDMGNKTIQISIENMMIELVNFYKNEMVYEYNEEFVKPVLISYTYKKIRKRLKKQIYNTNSFYFD